MKKISAILLIIILINFIFGNYVYATSLPENIEGNDTNSSSNGNVTYSKDSYDKLMQNGTVNLQGEDKKVKISKSTLRSYEWNFIFVCKSYLFKFIIFDVKSS